MVDLESGELNVYNASAAWNPDSVAPSTGSIENRFLGPGGREWSTEGVDLPALLFDDLLAWSVAMECKHPGETLDALKSAPPRSRRSSSSESEILVKDPLLVAELCNQ